MSKSWLFLAILAIPIGFVGVSWYLGTLPQITQGLQPLINVGQSIYARWATLPDVVQKIIIGGIPLAFGAFFAWTNLRRITQVQQLQQQVTQASGEKNLAYQQVGALQTQKAQLTKQLEQSSLTQSLEEAQLLVEQKQTTINSQLEQIKNLQRTIAELNGTITGMQKQIEYVKRIE